MDISKQAVTYLQCRRLSRSAGNSDDYMRLPRPHFSIAYVLEGQLECTDANKTVIGMPGDIVIIPYQLRYRLRWGGSDKTTVYSCQFNFEPFSEPYGNKIFPLQKITGMEDAESDFAYLTEHIPKDENALGILSCFYGLCNRIYPALVCRKTVQVDERIQRAIEYLHANYMRKILIDDLAAICHMSPSRFYECFRREAGVTPIVYKNRLSVRAAEILLLSSNRSIEEISEEVGFSSSAYFRRVFCEITGKKPFEYRKNAVLTL